MSLSLSLSMSLSCRCRCRRCPPATVTPILIRIYDDDDDWKEEDILC